MSILLYIEGYHKRTFEDDQYLLALRRLDLVEYQDSNRSLLLTDGPDWVRLIKLSPGKTFTEKIWG